MNCKSYRALFAVGISLAADLTHGAPVSASLTNSLGTQTKKIEIPVSIFVVPTNSADGRDPFYPESTRFLGSSTNSRISINPVILVLQGISGTPTSKLAIINGRTLAEGEQTELTLGGKRVQIRCVEIKADSVTVEVEGSRHELKMRNL